jgi:hypothetical protein
MGLAKKKGDVFEAQRLIKTLRAHGHRPSSRTYTTLLATISNSRDPEVRGFPFLIPAFAQYAHLSPHVSLLCAQ